MAIENLTINISQFYNQMPTISIQEIREQDFIRQYCSKIEHGIYYYILIYFLLTLTLQLLFKFKYLSDEQYVKWSEKLHLSYLMITFVVLVQAWFRL